MPRSPVTFHAAYIDPRFHCACPEEKGIIVREGQGQFIGNLRIDTSTLAPGPHRLVLRADSAIADGTNSGLIVIPFTVR